jgi:hypothetical protein
VTAPFSRQPLLPQTNQDLRIEQDLKSESGSEDGWNGAAPPGMEREDVSSLAAGGRRAIESRPEERDRHDHQKTLGVGFNRVTPGLSLTFRHPLRRRYSQPSQSTPPHSSSPRL